MAGDAGAEACLRRNLPRWLVYLIVLGSYLTLRGYHSFDGDQAYRLPLLLHRQNPQLYADDPFVQAFDGFNPHRGALVALDVVTRPLGLSAGLFVTFVVTFGATCLGVDRLARCVWPDSGENVGLLAVGLILAAKAGNIGTNHLFEAMVLDRLIAFALGWLAFAQVVTDPLRHRWLAPAAICLATLIHPSVGLQLAMLVCTCWVFWSLLGRWTRISIQTAIPGIAALIASVIPGLAVNIGASSSLVGDMPADVFWLLSVELQSPQHMLPHLWRMPQWLAWSSYVALAGLACAARNRHQSSSQTNKPHACDPDGSVFLRAFPPLATVGYGGVVPVRRIAECAGDLVRHEIRTDNRAPDHAFISPGFPPARTRLIIALVLVLAGLALAWYFIEIRHHVRLTVFQPFRMATMARGIALLLIAGRLLDLWRRGTCLGRLRATLIAVAFIGDWLLVVVTLSELTVSLVESFRSRISWFTSWSFVDGGAFLAMLALGLNFLGHHDTEYGHIPLLAALGVGLLIGSLGHRALGRVAERSPLAGWIRPPSLPPACDRGARGGGTLTQSLWANWTPLRLIGAFALAWIVPLAALVAATIPWNHAWSRYSVVTSLLNRCRFIQVPVDDVERLALWCQANTPPTARFIGPPGPKTFRLWSLRNLAFNRAGSPYHASGLADWYARFQDHVNYHVAPAEFVRAYVRDRHRFEARYQAQSDDAHAALAVRQGASYVVAAAPSTRAHDQDSPLQLERTAKLESLGPLELLHVEGRYAVYRVKLDTLVQRQW
jgi:hypothetical protein